MIFEHEYCVYAIDIENICQIHAWNIVIYVCINKGDSIIIIVYNKKTIYWK